MKLVIEINRDGVTPAEIKTIREFLSDLTSHDIKGLCEGNTYSMKRGCEEDGLTLTCTIPFEA